MDEPRLFLYTDRPHPALEPDVIVRYLKGLGLNVELKGDFFEANGIAPGDAAAALARCRVKDLQREGSLNTDPGEEEIGEETLFLKSHAPIRLKKDRSNLYDGLALCRFYRSFPGRGLHLIFTSRMPATYEGRRYHGRVVVMDFPAALISTTGIVEAPARPREFYIKLAAYHRARQAGLMLPEEDDFTEALKEEFKERFIDYDDPRLTEAAKGYALQAIFYLRWGEAFCPDPGCRLYNAHTQEEMIHAQIESGGLCERHRRFLERA
ncbi:MAG: hypothetical protein D6733_04305 [Methanobacteriota archaeon]|nr:MAG: hypothetical protein D6733_04305 [Euryarchaeota archaeon]